MRDTLISVCCFWFNGQVCQLFPYDVNAAPPPKEVKSRETTGATGWYLHWCTEVIWQRLQEVKRGLVSIYRKKKRSTGCPTGGRWGLGASIVLPGSGIVPHVYSSPPRSQPRGHCTADIPGPPPQASSSSSSLYGLGSQKKKTERHNFNLNVIVNTFSSLFPWTTASLVSRNRRESKRPQEYFCQMTLPRSDHTQHKTSDSFCTKKHVRAGLTS